MKIVFFGTPEYLDPIIQTLQENFDLIKTIRSPEEPLEDLNKLNPDLFVVASFGKIIPENILKIPKYGAINIHPSKLPKYRGPSPIQNQILGEVKESAISYILMDSEVDHGPILRQVPFEISDTETFESLCRKMFSESAKYLPEVVNGFARGSIKPKEQNHEEATLTKLVEKKDGYFDIDNPSPSEKLELMMRAYYPWPSAWTKWKGRVVKFLPEGKIQMEGRKATSLKNFLNGYPDFPLKYH